MDEPVRTEVGGKYKFNSEMHMTCQCGCDNMSQTGFDGDEGLEFWECPSCGVKAHADQIVIKEDRAWLIQELAKELSRFKNTYRSLSIAAREIAMDHFDIRQKMKLLDYLRRVTRDLRNQLAAKGGTS